MEKMKLTQEMIDSGKSFEELGFVWVDFLPYAECEQCAFELAGRIVIIDPDGVVYYSYNQAMIEAFYKLKYFSNIDTDDWDNEEGMRVLYDFMRRNDLFSSEVGYKVYHAGWETVWDILSNLYDAMDSKHTKVSSLSYKIGKMFASVLADEDIIKKIAESREVSEKMIDMLKIVKESEEAPKKNTIPMAMFAKK